MTSLLNLDGAPMPAPRESWLAKNWLGVVMLAGSILWQGWAGSAWVFGRESSEQNLLAQVAQLKAELDQVRTTYVRQDVFSITMQSINDRLASIDRKLSERR